MIKFILMSALVLTSGCASTSAGPQAMSKHTLSAATCLVSTQYIVDRSNNTALKSEISVRKAQLIKAEPDRRKRKSALQIVKRGFSRSSLISVSDSHPAYKTMSIDDLGIVIAQLGRRHCA